MSVEVKICGINDAPSLRTAIDSGAHYVGFVFYPSSRNAITPDVAAELARMVPRHVTKTGLFVDPSDDDLRDVLAEVPLDLIQLHGKETPQRVAAIRALTKLPAMMAIRITSAESFRGVPAYDAVADRLLFDSRLGAEMSGGPIDWALLKNRTFEKPWMLAGGLTTQNLVEAVHLSGAKAIDVSSGVEDTPGHKDPAKIHAFITRAAQL
jgi:phosphoribosylanthranilate isomerase